MRESFQIRDKVEINASDNGPNNYAGMHINRVITPPFRRIKQLKLFWNTSNAIDDWSINKQGHILKDSLFLQKKDFAEIGGITNVWLKAKKQIYYIVKVLNMPVWGCRDNKDGHKLLDNYKSDFWTSSKESNTLAWFFTIYLGSNTSENQWNSFDKAHVNTDKSFPEYFSTGKYVRCIRK